MHKISIFSLFATLLFFNLLPTGSSFGAQLSRTAYQEQPPTMGDFIDVWMDDLENTQPAIAYNTLHREFLVVWVTEQDEYNWNLWGQRVRADGSLVEDGWFNIDSVAGTRLSSPAVAYDPHNDRYLVVYANQASSANYNIWGRLVDWDGVQHNRLYLDSEPRKQDAPTLAYNSNEPGFLLAYHSEQPSGGYYIDLRALGPEGNILHAYTLTSPLGEFRLNPCAVFNPQRNDFFIVYGIQYNVGPPKIAGRIVSPELSQIEAENDYSEGILYGIHPTAALGKDEYLVTWFNVTNYYVAARRAGLDGTPLGPAGGFMISIGDPSIMRTYPRVAHAGISAYLLVWNNLNTENTNERDVHGRLVGFGQDQPLGDTFAIDARPSYQAEAALSCTPAGTCLAINTHNDSADAEGDRDISARLILMTEVYLPLTMRE